MSKRLAFIVVSVLLFARLVPGASSLPASAAPHLGATAPHAEEGAVASPQTSVCDYANALVGATIAIGFGSSELDPQSGIPLSDGDTPQSVLDQLQQAVVAIKAMTPPDGWEDFHAQYGALLDTFVNALPPAVAALNAGDQQTAHDVVTAANQAFESAGQDLDQAFPDVQQQLNSCS